MQPGALRPYERSLITREPLRLHHADGRATTLEIDRYLDPADAVDRALLARATGPALDVGCGPGRIVEALADMGLLALGVDIAQTAVAMTRARGLNALRRSVFDRLPGEGRWQTVVLIDGNVGIGGNPAALLSRARTLLSSSGRVLVETHADADRDEQLMMRFTRTGAPIGPAFPWAQVGVAALGRHAQALGFRVDESWRSGGRCFAVLSVQPR